MTQNSLPSGSASHACESDLSTTLAPRPTSRPDLAVTIRGGQVKVHAVLDLLGLWHALQEQPRSRPFDQDGRVIFKVEDAEQRRRAISASSYGATA